MTLFLVALGAFIAGQIVLLLALALLSLAE